jgi:exonuclease III
MRVITWNIHGAKLDSQVWEFLLKMNPDIIILLEVGSIPQKNESAYD